MPTPAPDTDTDKRTKATAKADRLDARKPRGFPDRAAPLLRAERRILDAALQTYERWGFEALDTGAFEYSDTLGRYLPDEDRPGQGVFALEDDDGQWMSLRYDLTAPLARFVAEAGQGLGKPFRRHAAGPVFRNEKPGPGRFREFLQCDADTVGAPGFHADAEMVAMGAEALRAAGLERGQYLVRVNSRRLLDGVLERLGPAAGGAKARLTVLRALDKLDRLGEAGVADLLGEGREDESGDFTKGAGLDAEQRSAVLAFATARRDTRGGTLEALGAAAGGSEAGREGIAQMEAIVRALDALGAHEDDVILDPSVVRGLEYYTGPVFEAELTAELKDYQGHHVQIGSVGGGGRYDDLVARFTGQSVPCTGFSIGVTRLAAALDLLGEAEALDGPVVVLSLDKADPSHALGLAAELRAAGLRAETYMGGSGMRAQMKYADRRRAPAAVIAGSDEIERGTVTVKDLALGKAKSAAIESHKEWVEERPGQREVPRSALVETVREIVDAAASDNGSAPGG